MPQFHAARPQKPVGIGEERLEAQRSTLTLDCELTRMQGFGKKPWSCADAERI